MAFLVKIHRHTGGLENIWQSRLHRGQIHRHTGGLEKSKQPTMGL